jgi:CHAD domain-containing protein
MVRLALGADIARLLAADPIARLGDDPEGVHQARVAVRRLRSHLGTFRPLLRSAPTTELADELRWLGRRLCAVRDLDVLRARFATSIKAFDPREREDAFDVLGTLDRIRARETRACQELLRRARYRRLVRDLAGFLSDPPFRRSAGLPASPFLSDVLFERFVLLERAVGSLGFLPTDEELHAVRITAKPLRYAAEVGAKVLGPSCGRLARRTAEVCDDLGNLNDGARAIQWLEEQFGEDSWSVAVVRLRAGEAVHMADARAAWPRSWDKLREVAREMHWPIAPATTADTPR